MRRHRILVVDDDDPYIYARWFEKFGFDVITAMSGREALSRLHAQRPDAAVIDICIPGMDGIELLQSIRRDPTVAGLPTVLMTGLVAPRSLLVAAGENLGIVPIFAKGGDLKELLMKVESSLKIDAARSAAEPAQLIRGGLRINPISRQAWVNNIPINHLAARRFDLLCFLARETRPQNHRTLQQALWPESDGPNIVDVNVRRLRHDLALFSRLRSRSKVPYDLTV